MTLTQILWTIAVWATWGWMLFRLGRARERILRLRQEEATAIPSDFKEGFRAGAEAIAQHVNENSSTKVILTFDDSADPIPMSPEVLTEQRKREG